MNEKGDCIHYSEVQDMNATVPCCDFYEFGNTPCKDCKRYYSKKDLVAVVRCKDCKYSEERRYNATLPWCDMYCVVHKTFMRSNDFCSYGERREKE